MYYNLHYPAYLKWTVENLTDAELLTYSAILAVGEVYIKFNEQIVVSGFLGYPIIVFLTLF